MKKQTIKESIEVHGARERLIEVATQLFAEKGLDGVSTRDISKAAGLNISLISYYFGGKEGLYKAVILDFALKAQARLTELLQLHDLEKMNKEIFLKFMRSFVTAVVRFRFSTPHITKILTREAMAGLPYAKEVYENIFRGVGESVIQVMKRAQDKKILRQDIHLYVYFLSLVHVVENFSICTKCDTEFIHRLPNPDTEEDQYVDQIYKLFVEGIIYEKE
ncbi:MAG: TetR family transcriptional regulator [Oligoflexia bacterium]|nr:MAG: TetR family transcriptional regulator [Oligoflexia bacterium]